MPRVSKTKNSWKNDLNIVNPSQWSIKHCFDTFHYAYMPFKLISALYKRNRRSISEEPIYWLLVRKELKIFVFKAPPPRNSNDPLGWGYGYFLEPHVVFHNVDTLTGIRHWKQTSIHLEVPLLLYNKNRKAWVLWLYNKIPCCLNISIRFAIFERKKN